MPHLQQDADLEVQRRQTWATPVENDDGIGKIQSVESGNLSDYTPGKNVALSNCTPAIGLAVLFASIPLGDGQSPAVPRQWVRISNDR